MPSGRQIYVLSGAAIVVDYLWFLTNLFRWGIGKRLLVAKTTIEMSVSSQSCGVHKNNFDSVQHGSASKQYYTCATGKCSIDAHLRMHLGAGNHCRAFSSRTTCLYLYCTARLVRHKHHISIRMPNHSYRRGPATVESFNARSPCRESHDHVV